MNKEDFYKMIEDRGKNIKDGKSNCFGTALYLTGEKDIDEYEEIFQSKYFKKLKESNKPEKGFLIIWYHEGLTSSYPMHAGVIKNVETLLVSNRRSASGNFHSDDSLNDLESFYSKNYPGGRFDSSKFKYLIPPKLQKILEEEIKND